MRTIKKYQHHGIRKRIIDVGIDPLELAFSKLKSYPERAKYVQIEKATLENLLNEYELTREELENIKNDTG